MLLRLEGPAVGRAKPLYGALVYLFYYEYLPPQVTYEKARGRPYSNAG
jgi:hypothetical protein